MQGIVSLNLFGEAVVIHYDVTGVDTACENGPTNGKKFKSIIIYAILFSCIFILFFFFQMQIHVVFISILEIAAMTQVPLVDIFIILKLILGQMLCNFYF